MLVFQGKRKEGREKGVGTERERKEGHKGRKGGKKRRKDKIRGREKGKEGRREGGLKRGGWGTLRQIWL